MSRWRTQAWLFNSNVGVEGGGMAERGGGAVAPACLQKRRRTETREAATRCGNTCATLPYSLLSSPALARLWHRTRLLAPGRRRGRDAADGRFERAWMIFFLRASVTGISESTARACVAQNNKRSQLCHITSAGAARSSALARVSGAGMLCLGGGGSGCALERQLAAPARRRKQRSTATALAAAPPTSARLGMGAVLVVGIACNGLNTSHRRHAGAGLDFATPSPQSAPRLSNLARDAYRTELWTYGIVCIWISGIAGVLGS
jgi:hypothetical protein